jgi:hypothetical protein
MYSFLAVPLAGLTWVVGILFLLLAAHYFLAVIESTSSGSDEIHYPKEPILDWIAKAAFLLGMGCVWAVIPAIVYSILSFLPDWMRLMLAGTIFAIIFPFGLLSALSSTSVWTPFSVNVARRLVQRKQVMSQAATIGIPVFIFVLVTFSILVRASAPLLLVPPLAIFTAIGLLIYARVLGLLGFVLTFTAAKKLKKKKKKAPIAMAELPPEPVYAPRQPSELPGIETPYEGALVGYDVKFDDGPPRLVVPILPTPTQEAVQSSPLRQPILNLDVEDEEEIELLEDEEVVPQGAAVPESDPSTACIASEDEEDSAPIVLAIDPQDGSAPPSQPATHVDTAGVALKEAKLRETKTIKEPKDIFAPKRVLGFLKQSQSIIAMVKLVVCLGGFGVMRWAMIELSKES